MKVTSDKIEIIFKHKKDDKIFYSIGLSHKTMKGEYENDYMPVRFRKDVYLENDKTRIKIKNAWLDFYKGMKFIFVNDFEIISDDNKEEPKQEKKQDGWGNPKNIEISPDELPFY